MSRYGGFRINRILTDWSNRKSASTSAAVTTPTSVQSIDYSKVQGIWNLRSTTQFPKQVVPNLEVSSGAIVYSTSASFSLPYPSDVQEGDLLLVMGLVQSATIYGTISGWSNYSVGAGSYNVLASKTATGAESGNVTVSLTGSAGSVSIMYRVRAGGATPNFAFIGLPGFVANPTITLAYPPAAYQKAIHIIQYQDNGALTMSALDPQLISLQIRTTSYGMWAGYINTSDNDRMGDQITSSSGGNSMTQFGAVVYI
jgi:hypothetical protein